MAHYLSKRRSQASRDVGLGLFGVMLLAAGTLLSAWVPILAILGGIILLALAFGWLARVMIAGEIEAVFWLLLFLVGSMTLPLDSAPRRMVGLVLAVSGLSWVAWRVIRHERKQA